jgi:hypothetical protein
MCRSLINERSFLEFRWLNRLGDLVPVCSLNKFFAVT